MGQMHLIFTQIIHS